MNQPTRYDTDFVPQHSSSPTDGAPSREEFFLALQKGAEESKSARHRAVETAKTTSLFPSS